MPPMKARMHRSRDRDQVLWPIVSLFSVDMVNHSPATDGPAKLLLHHSPMHELRAPSPINKGFVTILFLESHLLTSPFLG